MKKLITQFYLARHGETEWNQVRRLQGQLDSPLTINGIAQANKLAQSMSAFDIQLVITSPLERAFSTAQTCAQYLKLDLKTHADLVERDFGLWQSQFFDDLSEQPCFHSIFHQVTNDAPPSGESGIVCAQRINRVLVSLANLLQESRVLVITHGDAIRCLFATMAQVSACDAYSQYGNGSVFPVQFCHQSQTLKLDSSHALA